MRGHALFRYLFKRPPSIQEDRNFSRRADRLPRGVVSGAGFAICIAGAGVVAWGVWEIHRPSALIAIGLELVALGWLIDRLIGD